ncbi:MAG: hypothetical protein HND49_04775 [Planctomycetes bacterium]|nr:hypothetical protein [Planctomycetota bacterium]
MEKSKPVQRLLSVKYFTDNSYGVLGDRFDTVMSWRESKQKVEQRSWWKVI